MSDAPPGSPAPARPGWAPFDRIAARFVALDAWLFPVFAGACVLYAAAAFYGSMMAQTHGAWSAPLDDVFIHFDYARATARGYPFQWSEGNGFSSGNTSVTYPFVLALGYWAFARGMEILVWAAVVACVSTLIFLWTSSELFSPLGRWAKYLAPPAVLSLGALDWTLFSGMENAFHLAVWGANLSASLAVVRASERGDAIATRRRSLLLGGLGAFLVLTRPESVISIAAFAVFAALAVRRNLATRVAGFTLAKAALPAVIALVAQAVANRALTGDFAANGAIVKLSLNNPYMPGRDKLDEYLFLLKYVVLRNTQHHFADAIPWGWMVPLLALVPFTVRRTRPLATLLWVQVIGWLALVALNGQVRWQNERYTMPAVAWLLLLAAMGLAIVALGGFRWIEERTARAGPADLSVRVLANGRVAAAALIACVFAWHQAPNMRDQIWFFGRACRNIHDQHVVAGQRLHKLGARRVLVGDAGALIYAADTAGLDIIGLGGYKDLPFARASVNGLGASLELIERMPPQERPDYFAIYPSWWGDLPSVFGRRVDSVAIAGNVICGDSEKVIYRADWSALDARGTPRSLRAGETVFDELDVADLVSERRHDYVFPHPAMGFVDFRVLPDPGNHARDLFDAGRIIPRDQVESATMHAPAGPARLVLRTATSHAFEVAISVDGRDAGTFAVRSSRTWSEIAWPLPGGTASSFRLALTPRGGDLFDAHLWVIEERAVPEGAAPDGAPVARDPRR